MRNAWMKRTGTALAMLAATAATWSQAIPTRTTRLVVSGHAGEAAVVQVAGRSYVDIEALARVTGGTLGFQGSRIVLTLPPPAGTAVPIAGPGAVVVAPVASSSTNAGAAPAGSGLAPALTQAAAAAATAGAGGGRTVLSREFVTAEVSAVSQMREWRVTLVHAVQNNQPVSDDLLSPLRRAAETQVSLAAAAARSDADRSAATLLQNQLTNLRTLSSNYIGVHDTITAIRTDALDTDPLSTKVQNCMQGLAGMQAGGAFQDIATCH